MDSAGEDAGVNAAGDGRVLGHFGHDWKAQDLGHVRGPEASGRLVDEDHAVVGTRLGRHEAAEGEVAGSPDHDVMLVPVAALRAFQTASGVHHDEVARMSRSSVELEVRSDGDRGVIGLGRGNPQKRGHACRIAGNERGGLVPGTEQGQCRGDRAGPVSAAGTADADGSCHVDLLNVDLNGRWTCGRVGRAISPPPGTRTSPTGPGVGRLSSAWRGPPLRCRRSGAVLRSGHGAPR
jgi:hypothetical protein